MTGLMGGPPGRLPARAWLVVVLVALALAACSGESATPSRPTTAPGGELLPPPGYAELAAIFDPLVEPLGVRLTRGALVSTVTRRPSPTGRHLALYVEPTDADWTLDRYAETIVPLTGVMATHLFERWPSLQSFDVCQEPPPGVDDRPEPPTVATVDLTRRVSESIDWDTVDLTGLLTTSLESGRGLLVTASDALQQEPIYRDARAAAEAKAGDGG